MCGEKYPVWGEADDDGEQSNWGGMRSVGLLLLALCLLLPVESSHGNRCKTELCAKRVCSVLWLAVVSLGLLSKLDIQRQPIS